MNIKPLTGNYFSEKRETELRLRWFFALLTAVFTIILVIFWAPLRTQSFMTAFAEWRPDIIYDAFALITMIGDDIGHIFIILIVYWCLDKKLGFSTMIVLLSSAIYMHLIKGIFDEPRPLEGQKLYDCLSFPSGHTLTTFAVWSYLAIRIRHKALWIAAAVIAVLVGISRVIVGVHFPGDIIGGFIFGIIFLAVFLWISRMYAERGGASFSSSFSVNLIISVVVFSVISVLVLLFYNTSDATMVAGFLAGLITGNILEQHLVKFKAAGKWYQHLIKLVFGLGILYFIARGLEAEFLSEPHWRLLRFAVTGLWITFIAPFIFVLTGLCGKDEAEKEEADKTISA